MDNYEINEETYAIIGTNYGKTRIIEKEKEYNISNEAYSVMDDNCKYYGSSYKGRLEAAKEILNCSYKLPIIVEESTGLVFFPIKSSLLADCTWINLDTIQKVEKEGNKSKIIFENGKCETLDISKLSLDNQIYRATKLSLILKKRIESKKRD